MTHYPFTAATLSVLAQTDNEWLHRLPPAEMSNRPFATLAWMYVHSQPAANFTTLDDAAIFRASVLAFGESITVGQLQNEAAHIEDLLFGQLNAATPAQS